jgi:O-methyltransferase involved in polyketide biosynthesis
VPALDGVPETMLWALHNRASEARRRDGVLTDPESLRIYRALAYDFDGHFGTPTGSLAMRAAAIDRALRNWLDAHPSGFVVSLGEGLETPSQGVFIVAQGLLMYLEPASVQTLLVSIAERFPGACLVFDVVPKWFSRMTLRGVQRTARYRLPPMPWGIDRDELRPTLGGWHPGLKPLTLLEYGAPRGLPWLMEQAMRFVPAVRHGVPSLVQVSLS